MKRFTLLIVCLLSVALHTTVSAAYVTKVTITAPEPVVGQIPSYSASVPQTASTEVYEVVWSGEFDNDGRFIQGNNYTMTVKLRIKSTSSNIFTTTQTINATVNGRKARTSSVQSKKAYVKYTWKELGGPNPNDPKYKLKTKLKEIAAAYTATNADNDKVLIKYIKSQLPGAEVWSAGGSYTYTRKVPTETVDGHISVSIGITYGGVTLDRYPFTVVLPALNKSPEAIMLQADMNLMKAALNNFIVNSTTTGNDILSAVNAAAVNGTKAAWDTNYRYTAPTATIMGSIDGNIIFTLGRSKDFFRAHKSLPIAGDSADAAIDEDFSRLSKALHNYSVNNSTTQQELVDVAQAAMKNGSKLTPTNFIKQESTYNDNGKIIIYFDLELDSKHRAPRISLPLSKLRATLPTGIDVIQDEWEVLRIVNKERYKNGSHLLILVPPLQDAANIRAEEHMQNPCIGHNRPDGSSCFTAIDPTFKGGRRLGENLAVAQNPAQAMEAWMNSKGHRANILSPNYLFIGIGTLKGNEKKSWMQMFSSGAYITSAVTSTGSNHFKNLYEMERAYIICTTNGDATGYIPLDDDYMVKNGNNYTIHLYDNYSLTVTVGDK